MAAASGIASGSTTLRSKRVIRSYSSAVSSTNAKRPRSMIKTGPFSAAFFALLVSWLNSRLDTFVKPPMNPDVVRIAAFCLCKTRAHRLFLLRDQRRKSVTAVMKAMSGSMKRQKSTDKAHTAKIPAVMNLPS